MEKIIGALHSQIGFRQPDRGEIVMNVGSLIGGVRGVQNADIRISGVTYVPDD
jgi:alanine dehydrogenase